MSPSLAIYRKELAGYFYSLTAYVFIVVFLTTAMWLALANLFLVGQTSLRGFFSLLPWFYLFLIPALTMRLWAEEKRQGTAELLFTWPLPEWQAVVAKWAAAVTFLAVVLAFSLPLPITLAFIGPLDPGPVLGGYAGALLLGAATVSLGQYLSALTTNQIAAFLVTIAASFAFMLVGLPVVLAGAGPLQGVLRTLSTLTHFESVGRGLLDLRDLAYYLSFSGVFLYLTYYALIRRHWR